MSGSDNAPDGFELIAPGTAQPRIAILMPIFRQRGFITGAVNSILAQRGIVAEIIISDDASDDGTFETARDAVHAWLRTNDNKHRIVLRRGRQRLRRDHLALLTDHATCDLVCQAHGDDESHPDRSRILVDTFEQHPLTSMVSVGAIDLRTEAEALDDAWPVIGDCTPARLPIDKIIKGLDFLIGFCQAWRRSAVASFPRLDSRYAPVGHDRILPFRAALAGEVMHIDAKLIKRRIHRTAWHSLMFDEPGTAGRFGWNLSKLSCMERMQNDLQLAHAEGRLNEQQVAQLSTFINGLAYKRLTAVLRTFHEKTNSGQHIAWVDEDILNKLKSARRRNTAAR